jgi:hypothetical protein
MALTTQREREPQASFLFHPAECGTIEAIASLYFPSKCSMTIWSSAW